MSRDIEKLKFVCVLQPLYLNNYPITNKIDFIALKQKQMDSM